MHTALQASEDAGGVLSEFAKFSAYSVSWYQRVAQNPDMPLDQLHPDLDVVALRLRTVAIVYGVFNISGVKLPLTLQHTDIERYQAVHAKLAKEVCRDKQAKKLWFTEIDVSFNGKSEGEGFNSEEDEDKEGKDQEDEDEEDEDEEDKDGEGEEDRGKDEDNI